jgi:hypothetical protein
VAGILLSIVFVTRKVIFPLCLIHGTHRENIFNNKTILRIVGILARDNANKNVNKIYSEFDKSCWRNRFPLVSFETHRETFHRWQVYSNFWLCVCERIIVIYRKRIILHNLLVPPALIARGLTPPDVAVLRERTRKPRLFLVYKYCTIN